MTRPELSLQDMKALGDWVTDFVVNHLSTMEMHPIADKFIPPKQLEAALEEPLPRVAQGWESALNDFQQKVAGYSVRVGHPRFLAWMRTSPLAGAVFAEALTAALNQSVAVWQGAPAATEVERLVLRWLVQLSGYADGAEGILTSGGSMANFVGLLLARQFKFPTVRAVGLRSLPPMAFYLSPETHYSAVKAIEMMGVGKRAVRCVPTDQERRMLPTMLRRQIRNDRRKGIIPVAAVATLGTTATGACDPIAEIAEVCAEEGVWLHVDGAYGGLAASIPGAEHCAAGLPQADSFTVDPHKTLFVPFEAGAIFTRHIGLMPKTFAAHAAYLPNSGADNGVHFRDYGPQLSRAFKALKIYLTLKIYGTDAILQAWAQQHRLAQRFADLLAQSKDFQLLSKPSLGIVTFRYYQAGMSEEEANALNEILVPILQRGGRAFLSKTRLGTTTALRACFITYRTTESDLWEILEAIRDAVRQVLKL